MAWPPSTTGRYVPVRSPPPPCGTRYAHAPPALLPGRRDIDDADGHGAEALPEEPPGHVPSAYFIRYWNGTAGTPLSAAYPDEDDPGRTVDVAPIMRSIPTAVQAELQGAPLSTIFGRGGRGGEPLCYTEWADLEAGMRSGAIPPERAVVLTYESGAIFLHNFFVIRRWLRAHARSLYEDGDATRPKTRYARGVTDAAALYFQLAARQHVALCVISGRDAGSLTWDDVQAPLMLPRGRDTLIPMLDAPAETINDPQDFLRFWTAYYEQIQMDPRYTTRARQ